MYKSLLFCCFFLSSCLFFGQTPSTEKKSSSDAGYDILPDSKNGHIPLDMNIDMSSDVKSEDVGRSDVENDVMMTCEYGSIKTGGICTPILITASKTYETTSLSTITITNDFKWGDQLVPFISVQSIRSGAPNLSHITVEVKTDDDEIKVYFKNSSDNSEHLEIGISLTIIEFNPKLANVYRAKFAMVPGAFSQTKSISIPRQNGKTREYKVDPNRTFLNFYTRSSDATSNISRSRIMGEISLDGTFQFSRSKGPEYTNNNNGTVDGVFYAVEAHENEPAFEVEHLKKSLPSEGIDKVPTTTTFDLNAQNSNAQKRLLLWSNASEWNNQKYAGTNCELREQTILCTHNDNTENGVTLAMQVIRFNTLNAKVGQKTCVLKPDTNECRLMTNFDFAISGYLGIAGYYFSNVNLSTHQIQIHKKEGENTITLKRSTKEETTPTYQFFKFGTF